jgi:hypothetical protein
VFRAFLFRVNSERVAPGKEIEMSREEELSVVRDQVSILAEQVARLMDVISIRDAAGADIKPAEEKLELLESLMWKLHRRHTRLKAAKVETASITSTIH